MQQLNEPRARPRMGRALTIAAALLCAMALSQPDPAYAGRGEGGGLHGGGGFQGGRVRGGGFHVGGGFHGDRFHDGGFGDRFRHGRFDDRFHDNRFFFGGWFAYSGWAYYAYYGYYSDSQPYSSQTWYYCANPSGYYPYVTQCNTGWQTVPAS
jgi:hypothetical protein